MQGLSALSGTFFRANSFFLPDAGRKNSTPSDEAALTGGRAALKRCDGFSRS
jgi:hypothetical protein